MKNSYLILRVGVACAALLPGLAAAQVPAVTGFVPGRNSANSNAGTVGITFSQPVTGASGIRVHGSTWRGHRAGTASGDGTTTLSFTPRQVFAPGEQVSVTVPATVRGAGTGGQTLAGGQVVQFQAAAGPATGTFGPQTQAGDFMGGTGRYDLTLADIDNDGKLDLLYTDVLANNTVSLLLGDGRGNFGVRTGTSTGSEPFSLTTADFNHNGNLDLMTSGWSASSSRYVVAIALGNGQGQFTPRVTLPTANGLALSPRVGDLNADGHLDVAFLEHAPNNHGGTPHTSLLVSLGDGQGNFTPLPNMVLPWAGSTTAARIKLADLNNDGSLDVLYSNINGQLETYLGNGLGGFAPSPMTTAGIGATLLADVTGDGVLDAILGGSTTSIYPGTGLGTFTTTATATIASAGYYAVQSADVDGDGNLDLLFAERPPFPTDGFSKDVHVWLNNGSGVFSSDARLTGAVGMLTTGDVDNNGTTDAVVLDYINGNVSIRPNIPLSNSPSLTSFTPGVAPAGAVVTLTGANFTGATAVLVGGMPVTGFTVVNGTTLTFTVPAGSTGGLITVITPAGQATSATALRTALATRPDANTLAVQLYPNPAHGLVQLQLPASSSTVQVELTNALGQRVRQAELRPQAGAATLNIGGLAPGLYTVRLMAGRQAASQQLVVE